ncbi:MAG: hypothetical protein WBG95_00895 [Sulfitobacter sp.]
MLDSQTSEMKRAAGVWRGRRIIVLGSCCGFGRGMVRALERAGAQVVAADTNATALREMDAGTPLPLKGEPVAALRRIGRAWGEVRLDAVLNLMPLRHPDKVDLNIAVLQGIVQGFMPALGARHGQIVSVAARPAQPLELGAGAMAPALLSAQAALAHALRRDGITLNLVNVAPDGVGPARIAACGLLSGALGPVTGSELRL